MRLIDADGLPVTTLTDGGYWTKDVVYKSDLDAAPTADAIIPVRCQNCKFAEAYGRMDGKTGFYCHQPNSVFWYGLDRERLFTPAKEPDDFCSYGERRCEDG